MSEICRRIHDAGHQIERFQFPYQPEKLPSNGVYLLFEEGERAHGDDRIVRVGTHRGEDQLPGRLEEHFLTENKDRSIFRKNVGRCLLNREDDPFLEDWELDLTSREMRDRHADDVDFDKQACVEGRVSNRIQDAFSFGVLRVPDADARKALEEQIVAAVSLCDQCGPSEEWLGRWSTRRKIRASGLWQEHYVNKEEALPTGWDEIGRRIL